MLIKGYFLNWGRTVWLYLRTLIKWLALSAVIGGVCGAVGAVFHIGVHYASELRTARPWLLFLLPAAGVLIAVIYKVTKTEGKGTNQVLDVIQRDEPLPFLLLPSIFLGTILTHLCGGSAGREGAALQMGGTIGYHTGRVCHLDSQDLKVATMAGMAAFFSALFGTPLAAAVFAILVVSVGAEYHAALVPCLASALTAYGVSLLMGVAPTRFAVAIPALDAVLLLRVSLLAALCALVSVLFCETIHLTEHYLAHWIKNPFLRAAAGGTAIILLTLLVGNTDYNGAGMEIITEAVEKGTAKPEAFLLKLVFTAVTLAAGFKGGEVVPSFFVGAAFGCAAGPLVGVEAGFAAAIGLICVFCGVTNCPLASIFLAVELFGEGGLLYFAAACFISYVLSGYSGLYSSQTFSSSKLKARPLAAHANDHDVEHCEK